MKESEKVRREIHGRTFYDGRTPKRDELLLEEIDRLEKIAKLAESALRLGIGIQNRDWNKEPEVEQWGRAVIEYSALHDALIEAGYDPEFEGHKR